MDFALSEQQVLLQKAARDFLKSECPFSKVREIEESRTGHDPALWRKIAELGWVGLALPEAYGGAGLGLVDLAVLFEEIGRAAAPVPMLPAVVGGLLILESGPEAKRAELLPAIASGERIPSPAVEEPGVVNDPRFIEMRASPASGRYLLSGSKLFVPYAHIADPLIIAARTGGQAGDPEGLTLFTLVNPTSRVRFQALKTIAGDRQFRVDFEDVPLSASEILGDRDGAYTPLRRTMDKATVLGCAQLVGGADRELEMTAEYTRGRVQFGRAIGTFQAVQHRLADMFIDVQAARWTTYQAVWRLDAGLPADRELAVAKFITGRACGRVAFSAQQLHGGIGVDMDYDLQFFYRREKALELQFGTPSAHLAALEEAFDL